MKTISTSSQSKNSLESLLPSTQELEIGIQDEAILKISIPSSTFLITMDSEAQPNIGLRVT